MKKIIYILLCLSAISFLTGSCTPFSEMNNDPTRMNKVNPGTLLNPILYEMSVYNWKRYNDYTFALMQSKVSTSSTNGVGWLYVNDGAGDGTWSTYYKWLNNIKEMEKEAQLLNEDNYLAVGITLRSWIYQMLTDAFGDVPMSEACRGNEQLFTPKFDSQKDIYRTLIDDLERANGLFIETAGLKYNTDGELLYLTNAALTGGKSEGILKWKKFCNSLRLRLLLRVVDVPEFNAKAELSKMLGNPTTYPVFTSNEEAAQLSLSGIFPQEPPMNRPQDFTSYVSVSAFFIDNLLAWNDPRLPIFATKATNDGVKSYIGLPSGYAVAPSFNGSQPNQNLAKAPMKLVLMNYAEVEFIKAELSQRGIVSLDAQQAYEKGVVAAIEQWGGVMTGDYFNNEKTAYDNTLERIMLQKYFALFFCDYQQWFEYNRTGLPQLPRGEGVPNGNVIPSRFKYPATVQRTNLKNYQIAKQNMGGDELTTKLFWQKNSN